MAAFCTNCATALEPGTKFCPSCGASTEVSVPAPPLAAVQTNAFSTGAAPAPLSAIGGKRYPVLRILAVILKIAAVLWLIGGTIVSLAIGGVTGDTAEIARSLAGILASVYFAAMSWAGAELLHVFMDIEENTRRAAAG